jgi:hypothetical protein
MDKRLYDQDFYLWTQEQAEALRREGNRAGGSNAIDWELVAEEVGDLGKSDKNTCISFARNIVAHLFKLAWTQRPEPRGHWKAEIVAFRSDLDNRITPSIRHKVEAELETIHQQAGIIASLTFDTEEPFTARDLSLRWTLAQILGATGDPL